MPDVTLRSFPAGAKVELLRRHGDEFVPGATGKKVSDGKVDKDSNVKLSAEPGEYWAVSEDQAVAVFIPDESGAVPRHPAENAAQTHPLTNQGRRIIDGPRGTVNVSEPGLQGDPVERRVHERPEKGEVEPAPHAHQGSETGPQRSATPLGEATPTDPGEPQPKPRQEDEKGLQRSSTETGEATPVSEDDAQPAPRQEDVKGRQRSSTETGESSRIGHAEPRGTSSNPSSREQAEGTRPTDAQAPDKAPGTSKPKTSKSKSSKK